MNDEQCRYGAAVVAPLCHVVLLNWLLSHDVDVTFDLYKHNKNSHINFF